MGNLGSVWGNDFSTGTQVMLRIWERPEVLEEEGAGAGALRRRDQKTGKELE